MPGASTTSSPRADGAQVFIGCTSDNHWQRFCEQFGFDEWVTDARLAGNAKRCEAREWMLPNWSGG